MQKLNDNELLDCWNNASFQNNNINNALFENKYLKHTNNIELKNAIVVNSRFLEEDKFISLVFKKIHENNTTFYTIYSLVIFDISLTLPPENSRIVKYCVFKSNSIDIMENIIDFKVKQNINLINSSIDEKFKTIMSTQFKTMKYKFGKELVDVMIKPNNIDIVPSLDNIINEIPYKIYEKEKYIKKLENDIQQKEIILNNKLHNLRKKELEYNKNKLTLSRVASDVHIIDEDNDISIII